MSALQTLGPQYYGFIRTCVYRSDANACRVALSPQQREEAAARGPAGIEPRPRRADSWNSLAAPQDLGLERFHSVPLFAGRTNWNAQESQSYHVGIRKMELRRLGPGLQEGFIGRARGMAETVAADYVVVGAGASGMSSSASFCKRCVQLRC